MISDQIEQICSLSATFSTLLFTYLRSTFVNTSSSCFKIKCRKCNGNILASVNKDEFSRASEAFNRTNQFVSEIISCRVRCVTSALCVRKSCEFSVEQVKPRTHLFSFFLQCLIYLFHFKCREYNIV